MPSVARRRRRCPPPWRRSATRPGATARRGAAQRSEARARRSAAQCRAAQCRAAPCGAARRAVAWRSAAPRGAAPAAPDLFFRGHLWRPFSARNTVESNVGRMERRLQFVLHFDFVWSRVFCSFLRFGLARFCRVRFWLLPSAFGAVPRLNTQAATASSFAPPAKLTQGCSQRVSGNTKCVLLFLNWIGCFSSTIGIAWCVHAAQQREWKVHRVGDLVCPIFSSRAAPAAPQFYPIFPICHLAAPAAPLLDIFFRFSPPARRRRRRTGATPTPPELLPTSEKAGVGLTKLSIRFQRPKRRGGLTGGGGDLEYALYYKLGCIRSIRGGHPCSLADLPSSGENTCNPVWKLPQQFGNWRMVAENGATDAIENDSCTCATLSNIICVNNDVALAWSSAAPGLPVTLAVRWRMWCGPTSADRIASGAAALYKYRGGGHPRNATLKTLRGLLGEQDIGAGVARAWRGCDAGDRLQFGMSGAGVARAWRGHVLFPLPPPQHRPRAAAPIFLTAMRAGPPPAGHPPLGWAEFRLTGDLRPQWASSGPCGPC
eukprot:gene14805-biopygen23135